MHTSSKHFQKAFSHFSHSNSFNIYCFQIQSKPSNILGVSLEKRSDYIKEGGGVPYLVSFAPSQTERDCQYAERINAGNMYVCGCLETNMFLVVSFKLF
jgi:hypothetical protein